MAELHPIVEPYDSGRLSVSDGNTLFWETAGTPAGLPAVYLHGGPGSGCSLDARRYFDPNIFRAVLFDQRGCGRSRPLADDPSTNLSTNTTERLVTDIEQLREHLGIDKWIVVGVSWGVTLGLTYAQAHPDRVVGMALGVITSGTSREVDWITRGMRRFFPCEWERFTAPIPESEREGSIAGAYARLLAHDDPAIRENAALRWCEWEDTHVSLKPGWTPNPRYQDPAFRMVFARLVTHYWGSSCFLGDGQLRDGMNKLTEVPAVLVHGRCDVSSALGIAWELHQQWPGSRLVVVDDAGHGGGSFTSHLVDAVDAVAATVYETMSQDIVDTSAGCDFKAGETLVHTHNEECAD